MTPALALTALLSLPATHAQPAGVAAFQPRFHVRIQPAVSRPLQRDDDREIVCGMVVIHKTPADDPKILLPARETGAAVRRIEPQGCGAKPIAAK
jgi:hypothetical protein